ncbi:MAG: Sugar porter (SP) family MFS transporter [Candidatus Tokpelaia hoelldobleri]|uniref:Sugar porter (SP) family MFS transporter n=1 Tax=Candidatus Tokpelaia hoelldobleri TaxID=1902579 RepID=A0A1U9JV21_9HYPH|nr:MAG: Sugar porter (SP) family MFS transporter [Candidatus Tokpelaia hoelldoblerii]
MEAQGTHKKKTILTIGFLGALAGLLFGLDTGVISGALQFIAADFSLSETMQERVVGALMLGAAGGAVLAGWLSYYIGRKYCLIIAAFLFIAGSLLCALTPNVEILVGARIVLGIALGIASYAAPLYLSEIAPEKIRGAMISLYQLLITIGILAAFVSDTLLSYWGAWRWMLGIVAIPAALLLLGVLVLPRSPRWLASKNRKEEAGQVLSRIRETREEVVRELEEIDNSLKIRQSGWRLFRENSNFRRSVGLGMLLQIMQQCTGINIVLYYAPKIIGMAGFTMVSQQMWGSVVVGLVNVLATFIAIGVVDRWGRRPTLISGSVIMAGSMALLGTVLSLNMANGMGAYIAVLAILVFIAGFAMSSGPLTWILCSEIQPLKGRDFGITVSTVTNWLANMFLAATFLTLISTLGAANTFWLYAVLNTAFIFVVFLIIPETKEISLEKIEANLMAGKKLRDIGQPRYR